MTKHLFTGLAVAMVALSVPAMAETKQPVHIYIWNDYLGEHTLSDFTAATGYGTTVDLYDSLELLEQKVLVGKSGYDIIVPTAQPTLSRLIKAGAVAKLDKAKLPAIANIDPATMKLLEKADPGNQYALPYLGGTVGLGILPDKIKAIAPNAPLDSWDLLLKPDVAKAVAPCGITVLDSATDMLPAVYHYLGLDPNSEKKDDLDKVEKALLAVRPYIKQFVTGQNINLLAGGDACVVAAYSGDAMQAQARAKEAGKGTNVQYIIPKEGAMAWWDTLAIPSGAPNLDGAYAYINFVLQPGQMAAITNLTKYPSAVPASVPEVDADLRTNPIVFPSDADKAKLYAIGPISAAADRARNRVWTKIKTGH